MLIRFIASAEYKSGNEDQQSFAQGEIVDLRDDLALRWVKRGLAIAQEPEPPPLPTTSAPNSKPKPLAEKPL